RPVTRPLAPGPRAGPRKPAEARADRSVLRLKGLLFPASYGPGRGRIPPTRDVVAGLTGLPDAAPDPPPRRERARHIAKAVREAAVLDQEAVTPPSGRAGVAA